MIELGLTNKNLQGNVVSIINIHEETEGVFVDIQDNVGNEIVLTKKEFEKIIKQYEFLKTKVYELAVGTDNLRGD